MNTGIRHTFGRSKQETFSLPHPDANVFIGGVADVIPTKDILIGKLLDINISDITNFSINYNNDISFTVNKSYRIQFSAFNYNNTPNVTHFIDLGGNCSLIRAEAFIGSEFLRFVYFPFLNLPNTGGDIRNFRGTGLENAVIPRTTLALGTSDNQIFFKVYGCNVYCDPINETSNSGSLDPDLVSDSFKTLNPIFVNDFTIPDVVENFTINNNSQNSVEISFSEPLSSNINYKYEVWINGQFFDWVYSGGNHTFMTDFPIKSISITTVDEFYNISPKNIITL